MSAGGAVEPGRMSRRESIALWIWLGLSLLLVALSFASGSDAGGSTDDVDLIYRYSTFVGGVVQSAFLIAVALGAGSLLPGRARALGLAGFARRDVLLALGVVALGLVVAAATEPLLKTGEKQGLTPTEWQPDLLGPFVLNVILFTLIGPFTEELFWRGLGGSVLRRFGIPAAVVGTAATWVLVHGLLEAIPALLVLGVGFGWVRMRSGSMWPSFVAHAAYNGLAILISVLAR